MNDRVLDGQEWGWAAESLPVLLLYLSMTWWSRKGRTVLRVVLSKNKH